MGSICSKSEDVDEGMILKSNTLDFDKHNDLLDQLVNEKYRAACMIQSRAKGILLRKKIKELIKLNKNFKKD